MRLNRRIAMIGAGNMSEAIIAGLLKAEVSLPDDLHASDILPHRRAHVESRYGITTSGDNREAAGWGSIVILSVEPQVLDGVLEEIAQALSSRLVISVAAGYPIARVASCVVSAAQIARAMPNTPSSVLAGVTALAFGAGVSEENQRAARIIFESIGKVVLIEEHLMDAVTGLSGSGPAYVYLMIEALADGGVKMGLPRSVAELLAAQTALGAARMLMESGEHPGRLKDRVASPGGTTIAGIHRLEEGGFRATLMSAVETATARARELGAAPP
ncbi:MAG: pyrroline-5-carboxylate reductase [Nitrospiraceae bacterium]